MPINPNIALGIQQPQPINMLGQMGQMYALKAAKQEIEGGEAVRDFFSQGGDLSTPEGQRQIMTAAPKIGGQLIKQQADIRKTQIDTLKDEIGLRRDALSNVRTPEEYLAWHDANHTGQLGSFFKSAGINPSRESIMAELAKPGGLEKLIQGSALGATRLQQNLMDEAKSVKVANIGAAAPLGQLALAREKFNLEQTQQGDVAKILQGGSPTNALAPTGAAAPVNALATPPGDLYSQIDSIDAQIRQLVGSGNPKAIAAAQMLNSQRTQLLASAKQQYSGNQFDMLSPDPNDPTKSITIRARQNQYGNAVPVEIAQPPLSVDASATGNTTISPSVVRAPPTPGQERMAETARVKEEGQKTVNTVLDTLNKQYQGLVNESGITDTSKSVAANLKASASSSFAGQIVGGAVGSKAQQFRDSVAQTRPLLLNAIKNASGMSAQQLNSNVELQTYLKAATDPGLSIQANIEALNNISELYGLGNKFKIEPPAKKGRSAPATSPASSGGVINFADMPN